MADKIGWDVDFYQSLSDTVRIISLSEKEIYLLGQVSQMIEWETRWSGDTSALDLSAIRGNIDFALLDEEDCEGGTMSCVDVADCIETDATVQEKLTENFIQNASTGGYTPNSETDTSSVAPKTLSESASAENLMPDDLDCDANPQLVMGLARAIVKELHETAEDFFEMIEYATNTAEAAAMAAEQIPLFGKPLAGLVEFLDWVLETMAETYMAAYSQSTEDELACMIFCYMMTDCEVSIDALINLYEEKGSVTVPPIDTLESVLTAFTELTLSADVITVAIFHYQILRILGYGAFAGMSAPYLKSLLKSTQASDYSYDPLCEDCPQDEEPQTYWRLYQDFALGLGDWIIPANSGSLQGSGIMSQGTVSPTLCRAALNDLGAPYVINALAMEFQVRGYTAVSGDARSAQTFNAVNLGGTVQSPYTGSATPQPPNHPNPRNGVFHPTSINTNGEQRSIRFNLQNSGAQSGDNFIKLLKVVVIGTCGAGDSKPPKARYLAAADFPTTVDECFP